MESEQPQAPRAEVRPTERVLWGESVVDDFAWMREKSGEVTAHLEAENAYLEAMMASTGELQRAIFDEIKSRVQETDLSVPVRKDGWSYYSRTVEGDQYAIHCRRAVSDDGSVDDADGAGPEQILLDENIEAADSEYFEIGVFEVSMDHRLLAWADDRSGDERFLLRFRDLTTGEDLPDQIGDVTYGSAWAADNKTFFYVKPDEATRPYQIWRHVLGTAADDDVCVFQEDDERFFAGIVRDKDDVFIQVGVSSAITDETWLLRADDPTGELQLVTPRRDGIEYSVMHRAGQLIIHTNDGAENFRIMTTPFDGTALDAMGSNTMGHESWQELVAERDDVTISGFDSLGDYLVLFERAEALTRLSVRRWSDGESWVLDQPEDVYSVWAGANVDIETSVFRYGYTSMVSPPSVLTVDLATNERTLLKQSEVLGGYDPGDYETWRSWAVADDGARIPISLVRKRGSGDAGPQPCVLYAYGAYEASMDPAFSVARLSLLDRGFVFAIAHVRGGGEMGRRWYLGGKFEHKVNTFRDTVSSGRYLVDSGVTTPAQLAVRGGSAGGLLVGSVINLAPELFAAAVAQVPFVDNINTMLDPSLPLTVTEWDEWGNPAKSEAIYRAMRSYSPYENVGPKPYPAVFATAGLSDPRVGFWEPAKWVQRLRAETTSGEPVLLWTDLGAGHGGPSGRYDSWRDEARTLAFIIDTVGSATAGNR